MSMKSSVAFLVALMALTACRGDDAEEQPALDTPAPETAITPVAQDTTEAGFWAQLQTANYRTWARWPGTDELYPGTEPHGMLLTTYVNDLALDALTNGAAMMPDGAIIVKENYMADSTFAAVTAMQKISGYDPANNDWYWAKWDPDGVAEVAGRVEMCAACHGANREADYLLTARPQT